MTPRRGLVIRLRWVESEHGSGGEVDESISFQGEFGGDALGGVCGQAGFFESGGEFVE